MLFNMLLAVAIGFYPANKNKVCAANETHAGGYTSDSELASLTSAVATSGLGSMPGTPTKLLASGSIGDQLDKIATLGSELGKPLLENLFTITYPYKILDVEGYEKCIDILSFIIRDYLPNNAKALQLNSQQQQLVGAPALDISSLEIAQMCVSVLIKFAEASIIIQAKKGRTGPDARGGKGKHSLISASKDGRRANRSRFSRITNVILSSDDSDTDSDTDAEVLSKPSNISGAGGDKQAQQQQQQPDASFLIESCSLKLLDLMHYFHLNAANILGDSIGLEVLWNTIWCPLLQGMFSLWVCKI